MFSVIVLFNGCLLSLVLGAPSEAYVSEESSSEFYTSVRLVIGRSSLSCVYRFRSLSRFLAVDFDSPFPAPLLVGIKMFL